MSAHVHAQTTTVPCIHLHSNTTIQQSLIPHLNPLALALLALAAAAAATEGGIALDGRGGVMLPGVDDKSL